VKEAVLAKDIEGKITLTHWRRCLLGPTKKKKRKKKSKKKKKKKKKRKSPSSEKRAYIMDLYSRQGSVP